MDLTKISVLSALTQRMAWLARRQEVLAQLARRVKETLVAPGD